ncbi:collagen-like triple helix repeat-containing protein [Flagellimonas sp. S174]|uniref:collagen-like triple helix repeat-containing protein n=1 Tax=Flagellimonas sp. S174 TaxID=3410790 RepID=UPI003BF5B646
MKKFNLLYVFSLVLALALVSCSGEDGMDGPMGLQGETGPQGEKGDTGTPGDAGVDGTDGVGFDELTRFGTITMVLEGNRPDFQAFRDSTAFKFVPVEATEIPFNNQLDITGNEFEFDIRRFLSAPDDFFQESYADFNLTITDLGGENETVSFASFAIVNYAVVGEDNKYFTLNNSFTSGGNETSEFEFTNLTFDPETNNLTFAYHFVVQGEGNTSGNTLTVSGTVDVTVLQPVQSL